MRGLSNSGTIFALALVVLCDCSPDLKERTCSSNADCTPQEFCARAESRCVTNGGALADDVSADTDSSDRPDGSQDPGNGRYVYFTGWEREGIYRFEVRDDVVEPVEPELLDRYIDSLEAPREALEFLDSRITASPEGDWVVFQSRRGWHGSCFADFCLVRARSDFSEAELIRDAGEDIIRSGPDSYLALGPNGDTLIYEISSDTGNVRQLYALHREGTGWGNPIPLTAGSDFITNIRPAISPTEDRIAYVCYNQRGTETDGGIIETDHAICEVNLDGSGSQVRIRASDWQPTSGLIEGNDLSFPSFMPNGDLIFRGQWYDSELWQLASGADVPMRLEANSERGTDASCVFDDGMVVATWTARPSTDGSYELKLIEPGEDGYVMLLTNPPMNPFAGISCTN